MIRFQGIGKAYYGKKDIDQNDNSYITTEWFVFFLLPIFPIKSFRLIKTNRQDRSHIVLYSSIISYQILEEIPIRFNMSQIIRTFILTYSMLSFFIFSCFLVNFNDYFILVPVAFLIGLLVLALLKSE